MPKITQETVDLVKRFEGLELKAYRDPVGVLTIGYGYTNRAGFGPGVSFGDVWTEQKAEEMLRTGLDRFGAEILPLFKVKPNDNEYGAFVSLAYNIGVGAFKKSTALRRFNAGDKAGAAEALTWFNKAGGKVLRGLVRRRDAERMLFLSEPESAGASAKPDAPRSSPASSTTVIGAVASAGGTVATGVAAIGKLDPNVQLMVVFFAGVALLGAGWVIRERLRKWAAGDR